VTKELGLELYKFLGTPALLPLVLQFLDKLHGTRPHPSRLFPMPMSMVMLHVSWLNASHKITFNGFQLTKCILAAKPSLPKKKQEGENKRRKLAASSSSARMPRIYC